MPRNLLGRICPNIHMGTFGTFLNGSWMKVLHTDFPREVHLSPSQEPLTAQPREWFALLCLVSFRFSVLLVCFIASLLRCLFVSLLICFRASLLLCFFASLFFCFFASLLFCFFASLLLCFFALLLCFVSLLCFFALFLCFASPVCFFALFLCFASLPCFFASLEVFYLNVVVS